MHRAFAPLLCAAALAAAAPAVPLAAQTPGFDAAAAAREDSVERALIAIPDTALERQWTHDLSARIHVAGTPAQAVTRDYVLARMHEWGLTTWTKTYSVYLPQPLAVAAWRIPPRGAAVPIDLREPPIPGDSTTVEPQLAAFNGSSGNGDVTGEVVYVGYGLIEDYRTLDSLGVSVKGKIAIARYGRSFRGIKAREAERHGAIGLILYSDPADDGYMRGDVYPAGPMRPWGGIQRGSVLNENGDPTTPGWASVPGARRVPEDSIAGPHIPVIPMSYGNAEKLLDALAGPGVPEGWQGGLPFHYHVGPGPVRVRLRVRTERGAAAFHPIWDTFAMIRGAVWPDQWVVVGAHRDAWGPGAQDNISGTVTVMDAARAFAELARRGVRPARTVIFATWDAEEWGLVGSTEWVEEMADSLDARVVAYVNEDAGAAGRMFGGSGSPSLKPLIRDVTRAVPAITGTGSVYDEWLRQVHGDTARLRLGNMGGGSDFSAFYHHLGIPAAEVGFGSPGGVYHSQYDDYAWMTRFGDPGYVAHRTVARLMAVLVARLADADVPAFDYAAFGTEMDGLAASVDSAFARKQWAVSTAPLEASLERFTMAARAFAAARDSALAAGLSPERAAAATRALMEVERRLTRPAGLALDPWFKSLQFAADIDNGYATLPFPSIQEALRYGGPADAAREVADVAAHVDAARGALEQAAAALR